MDGGEDKQPETSEEQPVEETEQETAEAEPEVADEDVTEQEDKGQEGNTAEGAEENDVTPGENVHVESEEGVENVQNEKNLLSEQTGDEAADNSENKQDESEETDSKLETDSKINDGLEIEQGKAEIIEKDNEQVTENKDNEEDIEKDDVKKDANDAGVAYTQATDQENLRKEAEGDEPLGDKDNPAETDADKVENAHEVPGKDDTEDANTAQEGDTKDEGEKQETGEGEPKEQEAVEGEAKAEDGTEKTTDEPDGKGKEESDSAKDETKKADVGGQQAEEGGEEEGEKVEEKDEEPKIPDDFYYDFQQFASKPSVTLDSGLPADMLTLKHSFGYDCTKRANLHILNEKTVMFAAGNVVLILDLQTKEQIFLRSSSGGGIGALAVHPSRTFFAVAEKGSSPNINIFEWPSLKLYRILRGGTERSYSFVDFNPDGSLLASQGGDPDFMLTVWDWKQEKTVLRSKAFSQDVFRATFSTELEGQLTTSGTVHIRFWKMADTFTGLKLQGELGKFGRTEISDIEGYVELPDGKVLSGSEWGNMLLWEGGLIKVEIRMKNKKPCHTGAIQQILLDEGELMSVGIDGFIRVWDFEAIDTADTTDDTGMFELDPMNELKVGTDVQLKMIIKSIDGENEPTIWYAQDANGGIWRLDLSFSHTSSAPEKLFTFHAGPITGCDMSPVSQLAATTGVDRSVRVFDYAQQKQICDMRFPQGGSSIIWMPDVVDPKGGTVVVGFQDGVVRLLGVSKLIEDSVRRKKHHECSLQLLQAFKPHSSNVTTLAIDTKGEVLASGSEDGTVFFMNIGSKYNPIGFVKVAGPVTQIQWSPPRFKKETVLVFCNGGIVQEIAWPDDGKFDTSHTFEIKGLPIKTFKFASIKSHLRHEEELERKAKEEEERKKKEEAERRKRIERGLETESEQGDEPEEEKEPEPVWEPYIPAEPSPILTGFYSDKPGTFWLSMGEFDAGYLYECAFPESSSAEEVEKMSAVAPFKSIPVLESNDTPICTIKWSKNGQQALFGLENGQIRIQNLVHPFDISELGPSWTLSVHDNVYGHITGLLQSHDGTVLISTGADGNFFQFSVMGQEQLDKKIAENKAKLPSAKKLDDKNLPDDIQDPKAYSIEEAKQKAEHDKMMREAEEKKKEVRRHITKMRRLFKQLLEQNEALPGHLRLHKDEFEMDREIKEELERHKREKIELVRRELAWESEKQRIALEKLRKRFKDVVECDRIVVKAFATPHEVASFRASKLSDDFYHLKADFERRKTQIRDDMTRDPTRDLLTGAGRLTDSTGQGGDRQDDQGGAKVSTTLKGSMGERITKALLKVEEKKRKRAERKAMWVELYETKPDDDYEDPSDIAAIKEAKDNMGDYKLKTANNYVVPDHLRMNVEKARGRLLILKDLIHEHKYNFNQRLLRLRDRKIQVIEEIRDQTAELEAVHAKLSADVIRPIPPVPEMHPEEMPEKKLEYTRETLVAFKKEMADKAATAKKGAQEQGGFGGFGGFGGGAAPPAADKKTDTGRTSPVPVAKQSTTLSTEKAGEETEAEVEELSPLEVQLRQVEVIRLTYEQERLLSRIKEIKDNFDAELRLLRHDKFKLDIIMKNADLRQVTLFEELVLLKEYEKREDVLAEKVTNKQQEKLDMQAKIVEVTSKLEVKKKEIEKLQEREKALYAAFQVSLGDNNKFADYLTKVFKKKIKRSKKKTTEGDDDEEDSDDDSDEDEDWDEEEDEDESESGGYDLDICPPGCDQNLYEATCQQREKRLDIEEALVEEKKTNDALKKELEGYGKKSKVIDSGLKTAQQDLEAFQLEKQQKLNELDVVVSLKLHQIQYMVNGVLPQDLSHTLVFESHGVTRLQMRIKELEHEKHSQKKYMKESKKKHVQLIKDRKTFESKISEMDEECEEMMVSKFGCVVDIEKLETVTVNRTIEELKEKLRITEIQCSEEVVEWNDKISEKKNAITDLIRENTKRLNQLSTLLDKKHGSEGSLDSRQKNLGEEFSGARKADIREKQRLIQLVQLQAQEIDALKEEILLLTRKGGHILPPAQPPLPQSPHMRTLSN